MTITATKMSRRSQKIILMRKTVILLVRLDHNSKYGEYLVVPKYPTNSNEDLLGNRLAGLAGDGLTLLFADVGALQVSVFNMCVDSVNKMLTMWLS